MKPEEAFGNILRDLRGKRGLTQEKLAHDANLDRTFISQLERGLKQPSLTTIITIASILEIEPSRILKLVEDELKKV